MVEITNLSKQACESAANAIHDIRSLLAPQLSSQPGAGGRDGGARVKSQSYSGKVTASTARHVCQRQHTRSVARESTERCALRKHIVERLADLLHTKTSWHCERRSGFDPRTVKSVYLTILGYDKRGSSFGAKIK